MSQINNPERVAIFMCRRGAGANACSYCTRRATLICDFRVGEKTRCNKAICGQCSRSSGLRDDCRIHTLRGDKEWQSRVEPAELGGPEAGHAAVMLLLAILGSWSFLTVLIGMEGYCLELGAKRGAEREKARAEYCAKLIRFDYILPAKPLACWMTESVR